MRVYLLLQKINHFNYLKFYGTNIAPVGYVKIIKIGQVAGIYFIPYFRPLKVFRPVESVNAGGQKKKQR